MKFPDVNILVHPECTNEVVSMADFVGSTEYIKNTINDAPANSNWAIGTEINLVKRLANTNKDKNIFCLDDMICPCSTMYMIHPIYLLDVLERLESEEIPNQIVVPENEKNAASIALNRMLNIST